MRKYALIGKKLNYSFSKSFFNINHKNKQDLKYFNIEIEEFKDIKKILNNNEILGYNITIPYKKKIICLLDSISSNSKKIGSINTIKVINGKKIGYNTDWIGFKKSIKPLIKKRNNALIIGDGGASKAIQFALDELKIKYNIFSRKNTRNFYQSLLNIDLNHYEIIINTTPLGTYPNIDEHPNINYNQLNKNHLVYDLIYNPKETLFLKKSKRKGAEIKNGYEMLKIQAYESWKIWGII